ncbi:MAG: hypothetical protein K6U80_10425, partial [Firmicutes bacterium]|nr:hypothetical protein [Bacillota bacterium]
MRLRLRKSPVFIGVLGIIMLAIAPVIFGGTFFWFYTFTGICEESFHYLPSTTPAPETKSYDRRTNINSAKDLITRPYVIPFKYTAYINTETFWPTDIRPYIKFYQCYANGNKDGLTILNLNDEGQAVYDNIYLLPPNRGIEINVLTGSFNMSFNNFGGFTCWYKIEYQLDQAAPDAPKIPQINGSSGDGFYAPESNRIYTRFHEINLKWNTPRDNTTPFLGYNVGGIVKDYRVNNGLIPMTQWVGGNQTEAVLPNEGSYNINVVARDYDNNISSSSPSLTVIADYTGPSGSLAIKKTDDTALYTNPQTQISYTNSKYVMLSITDLKDSGSGVSQIRFSNKNIEAYYSNWISCSNPFTQNNWDLTDTNYGGAAGDGVKTVYVQIKDKVGNITTLSKSVTLETVAPTGTINIGSDSNTTVITKNGVKYINGTSITLSLSASDADSGLSSIMKLSTNNIHEAYVSSKQDILPSGDGVKTVSVTYFDNAGNSYTCSDSIILDQTSPTGTIAINNGATYTGNTLVTLNLNANDGPGIGVAKMRIRDSKNDSGWIDYQTSKSWVLDESGGDGPRTVYIQYQDELNNYDNNKIYQASIVLDLIPPQGAFTVASRTGKVLDNGSNPTNSTLVRLANINVSDN